MMRHVFYAGLLKVVYGEVIALYEFEQNVSAVIKFDEALRNLSEVMRPPRGEITALAAYQETISAVSLQQMSTKAFGGSIHEIFSEYYGSKNFADAFTLAAIQGSDDFEEWDDASLRELATKGAAYLNTLQYVYALLQSSVRKCTSEDWDKAFAYFTGSYEGIDGTGAGYSVYALGDKRCPQFETCINGTSLATTNEKIRAAWLAGRSALNFGVCDAASAYFDTILALSLVPLIQGALREAFEVDPEKGAADADGKIEIAEGWAFVYPLLPLIDRCSTSAATTIRDNMYINADPILISGFNAVKSAFESVYNCLGISCADVGAMATCEDNTDNLCWSPCTDIVSSTGKCDNRTKKYRAKVRTLLTFTIIGWVFFALLLCLFLAIIYSFAKSPLVTATNQSSSTTTNPKSQRKSRVERDTTKLQLVNSKLDEVNDQNNTV